MIFAHWAKYDKKKFYNWYVIGISVILGDHQFEFKKIFVIDHQSQICKVFVNN